MERQGSRDRERDSRERGNTGNRERDSRERGDMGNSERDSRERQTNRQTGREGLYMKIRSLSFIYNSPEEWEQYFQT